KHVDGSGNPFPSSTFTGVNDGVLDAGNDTPFKYKKTFWQLDTDEALINAEYEFDNMTLTSLTGYSHYQFEQSMDVDISPATLINTYQDENYRQFSQEIRITGEVESGIQYLAGVYYQRDTFKNDYFADFNTPLLVAAAFSLSPSDAEGLISPFSRHILLEQDTAQWAAFSNVNIPVTDQLTASLGYRYLSIKKEGLQAVRAADINHQDGSGDLVDIRYLSDPALLLDPDYLADPTGYNVTTPVLIPDYTAGYLIVSAGNGAYHEFDNLQRKEHHSMFQTALSYQWDDNLMSYLSWSNGAKAGGFDFLYEKPNRDDVIYEDEEASVFEIGFKKNWQTLQLNMALFYGDYDDLQVSVFDGGIGFTVGNAASSTSKGLDTQVIWQPTPQLRTVVQFEYLDFTYDDFSSSTCHTTDRLNTGQSLCDASGDETPFVPKTEGVIAFEYENPITVNLKTQHLLSWRYKGSHTTASDNEPQTRQSAYEIVDYRFDLSPNDEQWQVSLLINNLFDKEYLVFTSVIPLAPGAAFANIIPKGREVALAFQYHY
ncbi:MAG: TonB-dependent receptor, partial [Pseudomonadales bacterium]|nr:TonB-dependent receptor [Pseudomonadales bacterium]